MNTLPRLIVLLPLLAGLSRASLAADQTPVAAASNTPPAKVAAGPDEDMELPGIGDSAGAAGAQAVVVSDPIEPVNRAFFTFNDKLYFWVLKPVAKGYTKLLPQPLRIGVKNIYSNIRTPVRLVNCALQGEFTGAWTELERFVLNTTVGVVGYGDPARDWWAIELHDADLGQTLGRYGCGTSIYFVWPFLGPSNVRDTAGYAGDTFLNPLTYILPEFYWTVAVKAHETVNTTSLRAGEYEDFKNASIDPYVAMRDAYAQYRRNFVNNVKAPSGQPAGPWGPGAAAAEEPNAPKTP